MDPAPTTPSFSLDPLLPASELRTALRALEREGHVEWLRTDGCALEPANVHTALQSSLRRLGLVGECDTPRPSVVVLDWTWVTRVGADSLAFAAVLIRVLVGAGLRVICVPPGHPECAAVLRRAECAALQCDGAEWLSSSEECDVSKATRPVVPICMLGENYGYGELAETLDRLEDALAQCTWFEPAMLANVAMECVQNIRSHSRASNAALCVVSSNRSRSPWIALSVADDGRGIANAMLDDPRRTWVEHFSDARVTQSVFGRQLSRRDEGDGGGGLGELLLTLLADHDAKIVVRSGAGHVTRLSGRENADIVRHPTYGLGTQLLIKLRPLTKTTRRRRS